MGLLVHRRLNRTLPVLHRCILIFMLMVMIVPVTDTQAAPKSGQPKECPIGDLSLEAREEVLRSAPSCDKSLELFGLCSFGASGDVSLGAIVTEKCEADFLAKLSKRQRRAYHREQKRCAGKYRHESGSMYRSFEAYCGAEVARTYARRFGKSKSGGSGSSQ